MKFFIKTIYLTLITTFLILNPNNTFGRDTGKKHSKEEISNYLSGIISLSQNNAERSFDHLSKMKSLSKVHSNYNIKYIRSLVLLDKFEEAFAFAKSIWKEEELSFEIDLLLGLEALIKKDYKEAEKYFIRLNKISNSNFLFEDFFGNILISWMHASKNNENKSFEVLNEIPSRYYNLKVIHESFLNCYFDKPETEIFFKKVIGDQKQNFSRYNFFLTNYLLSKNEVATAKSYISEIAKSYNSPLLIRQTSSLINKNKIKKIMTIFDCKKPSDSIAEMFYVLANMYSTQDDYQTSNFYLSISLFLNKKFKPNKLLLAENYYFQNKFRKSEKVYNSLKQLGLVYSWFSSKSISVIIKKTKNTKKSILYLKKEFDSLPEVNFLHYYDLANYYKDNEYFNESIKYYSLSLKDINEKNNLIPKILDKRGISYERIGEWKKAEKDFLESLRLSPNQPYVLNYLAYTWVDKKMNINKALEMLEEAVRLKKNDGYIIDSLGWAHYRNKNYIEAEKFLQRAVKLLPMDPIINDHYADTLWMLNKNIQARYFWKHAISLDSIEPDIKEKINQKLIFGIKGKS